jgi:hypothetical protein
MFGELKREFFSNNKSNSSPCNLDCDPSLGLINLSPKNILLVDMVMVEGVAIDVFSYSCFMKSCAISLISLEGLVAT